MPQTLFLVALPSQGVPPPTGGEQTLVSVSVPMPQVTEQVEEGAQLDH